RVVEHLAYNLPPDPSVELRFTSTSVGNCVLIEEEMIDRPPAASVLGRGQRRLTPDQHPTSRFWKSGAGRRRAGSDTWLTAPEGRPRRRTGAASVRRPSVPAPVAVLAAGEDTRRGQGGSVAS